jgi:hypothetical protein
MRRRWWGVRQGAPTPTGLSRAAFPAVCPRTLPQILADDCVPVP